MQPPPLVSSTLCVTCDDIKQTFPYNAADHVIDAWRQIHNESVCCGPVRRVMELRIQNEIAKQYENTLSNSSLLLDCERVELSTPTAKLVGVVDNIPSHIGQGHSALLWNKHGLTFTANKCIHLELEGDIFIKKSGYFIVSSTLIVNTTGKNNKTQIFGHNLNLLSHKYGTTSVLMHRQKSINESDNVIFTSFISAVFKLHVNDRISISVSDPNYLANDNSNDHFTAYYTYDMS
ncbi:hypothetical protein MAR_029073 [Mya arenaria]|uniref:THD domain-containing protein n=2 Tax=Mya arenaria TaxID=6604 RepID=A0ABY7DHI0_MYAAR|nr:hypothetical protein MAR_029073 [Mya arenaria]